MAKLEVGEKLSSIKKLQELKNQQLELTNKMKQLTNEMNEVADSVREYKEIETKIVDAKRTMYLLLMERLDSGLLKNFPMYEEIINKEIENLDGGDKKDGKKNGKDQKDAKKDEKK